MSQTPEASFSREMRKATRKIHKISDDLVNAKVAFAMSDDHVWADGLLVFYDIFRYLEENASPLILPLEFHRTQAFENDLDHYLGIDWRKEYQPRDSVAKYLTHLSRVKERNPILLLAYVYHLYMGLLSGGQILQKKRQFNILGSASSDTERGQAVTKFSETIGDLKTRMRSLVDNLAKEFDEKTKAELIEESLKCFELNNEIVRTVKGVNSVGIRKVVIATFVVIVIYLLYTKLK